MNNSCVFGLWIRSLTIKEQQLIAPYPDTDLVIQRQKDDVLMQ